MSDALSPADVPWETIVDATSRLADRLKLDEETTALAIQAAERLFRSGGRSPSPSAGSAACIYWAERTSEGREYTQREIASAAGCSGQALRNNWLALRDGLGVVA